ncbi:MAG: hypothetical protein E2O68_03025 [Deltaproteobacteria bacterium]|nr:MAG: hypothetical protein E2O68_03025 [Deltaproteobacteria bacterium]
MKNTFILITILLSGSALSVELDARWNYKFEKEVVLTCSEDEFFCEDLCESKEKCIIKENVCRDCIGSTPYLTHVFNQLGRSIVKTDEAQVEDLVELLKSNHFAAITSKSVYNHVDRFGTEKIADKFGALCDFTAKNPVMVFEVKKVSKLLGAPKFLVCGSEIFHVDANGGAVLLEE